MKNPFSKTKDRKTLQGEWESCTGEKNVMQGIIQMPEPWAPDAFRVKVLVAGNPARSQDVSHALVTVQKELKEQFLTDYPGTRVLLSVESFLDGCRHATPYQTDPVNVLSETTRWHCYESDTQFSSAMGGMRNEPAGQQPDVVIIVGGSLNEKSEDVVREARLLHEEAGTRVFAVPTSASVEKAYEEIAGSGGGVSLPPSAGVPNLIREIAMTTIAKSSGRDLKLLPPPANDDAQKIRALIENKMGK